MIAQRPPMGWNSWNTFGENISEHLIFEMADTMADEGCLAGVPLMLGADLRSMSPRMKALVQNPALIALDQDPECRPPYVARRDVCFDSFENSDGAENPFGGEHHDRVMTLMRHLADNEFAVAMVNLHDQPCAVNCIFPELGLPVSAGIGLEFTDVFTGEKLGVKRDYYRETVAAHSCRIFRCRFA